MPATITIEPKVISLGSQLRQLLTFYREALHESGLKLEHDKEGPKSAAAPDKPQQREGFWARWVWPTIDKITRLDVDTKVLHLPPLTLEIDPPAEFLLNSYLKFLNSILVLQGLSAKDTEKEELTSVFALLRELLYRLVAIGLCNDSNHEQDGEILMKALERFLSKIYKSEILVTKGVVRQDKASNFLDRFSSEHSAWQEKIEGMVLSVKRMALHRRTISEVLTGLNKMKQAIQAHIIACLEPARDRNDFAIDWLATTLESCEKKWLVKHSEENNDQQGQLIDSQRNLPDDEELTIQQNRVVAICYKLAQDDGHVYASPLMKRLTALYSLLNRQHRDYLILSHVDLLISHGSWGPILAGIINFSAISCLLNDFLQRCQELLPIPANLSEVVQTSAGLALIKHQYLNVIKLSKLISFQIVDLRLLDDPTLHEEMTQMLGSTVTGLIKLQDQLKSNYQFIDVERIQALGLVQHTQAVRSRSRVIASSPTPQLTLVQEQQPKRNELPVSIVAPPAAQAVVTIAPTVKSLFFAALRRQALTKEMFDLFVMQGVSLTEGDTDHTPYITSTPLHIAAATGQKELCRWIIAAGVDVNIQTPSGDTPMDKAAKSGQLGLLQYFESQGGVSRHVALQTAKLHGLINSEDITAENDSVTKKHLDSLAILYREGANVNGANQTQTDQRGELPLHTLYLKGNLTLLEHFFVLGANPHLTDANDETPFERLMRVGKDKQRVPQFLADNYPQFLPPQKKDTKVAGGALPVVPGAFFPGAPKLKAAPKGDVVVAAPQGQSK